MAQYIDKDALIAEIERRIQESLDAGGATRGVYLSERMREDSYILSFIDTLEVKEVDLEEEICSFFSKNPIPYEHITDWPLLKNCAIYFFELGLKALKGK